MKLHTHQCTCKLVKRPRARSGHSDVACVAGAKKGRGVGEREKGKREGSPSPSPQSPSPFSLLPYPLPPTPFDACLRRLTHTRLQDETRLESMHQRAGQTCYKSTSHKLRLLYLKSFFILNKFLLFREFLKRLQIFEETDVMTSQQKMTPAFKTLILTLTWRARNIF